MIPIIIHIIGGKKLSSKQKKYRSQLQMLHPNWIFCIYNDKHARNVVKTQMPELFDIYNSYALNKQRRELFKFIAVYLFGGFYVNMNVLVLKAFDELRKFELVLSEETTEKEKNIKINLQDERIASYFFGSIPQHPFWLELIKTMISTSKMYESGSKELTDFFHANKHRYACIELLRNNADIHLNKIKSHNYIYLGDFAVLHEEAGILKDTNKLITSIVPRVAALIGRHKTIAIKNTVELLNEKPGTPPRNDIAGNERNSKIIVLGTHGEAYDGYSTMFHRIKDIGMVMHDTSFVTGAKVFVSGLPIYENRLSPKNINIITTTFESNTLPDSWIKAINKDFQYCIVPHNEINKVFLQSGIKIPIVVIQHGYKRYKKNLHTPIARAYFSVGFTGNPVARKNLLKLYAACKKLQETAIPEIKLAIHVSLFYQWLDTRPFEILQNDPMVEWTSGKYNDEQMGDWYSRLSCYTFPSSGEGWSFTPRESLYMGVPTILSDVPVHKELIESGYCKAIQNSGLEDANFNGTYHGQWQSITESDIANAILDVYNNYPHYRELATKGASWIENQWHNWDVQQQIAGFINAL